MGWIAAGKTTDVKLGEAVKVEVDPPVAVFNVDGELYAIDDTCTHGQSSLAEGYLEGNEVECIWHFARFCVKTGKAMCLPATKDVRTYPTKVDGDRVFVDLSGRDE